MSDNSNPRIVIPDCLRGVEGAYLLSQPVQTCSASTPCLYAVRWHDDRGWTIDWYKRKAKKQAPSFIYFYHYLVRHPNEDIEWSDQETETTFFANIDEAVGALRKSILEYGWPALQTRLYKGKSGLPSPADIQTCLSDIYFTVRFYMPTDPSHHYNITPVSGQGWRLSRLDLTALTYESYNAYHGPTGFPMWNNGNDQATFSPTLTRAVRILKLHAYPGSQ